MIRLIADSSSDRPALAGIPIEYVPLVISTEAQSFTDDDQLDVDELLQCLASYEAAPTPPAPAWTPGCVPSRAGTKSTR